MAEEKIFTVPLREAFDKPRTERGKVVSRLIRSFLQRHMKSEQIRIGNSISKEIFNRGIQKPPRVVRIHALKEDNIVYAELIGTEIKPPSKKELEKKEKKKKAKKESIKKERKERRKRSIQEELEEETKKAPKPEIEVKEETKEKEIEDQAKKEEKIEERV